jgi:hypothetical protein
MGWASSPNGVVEVCCKWWCAVPNHHFTDLHRLHHRTTKIENQKIAIFVVRSSWLSD